MQTRWQSFFESCINVAIGYGVALMSQILIFPLFGIHIPLASNLAIGAIFTVISIARSYAVRRVFNRLHCCRHSEYNTRNAISGQSMETWKEIHNGFYGVSTQKPKACEAWNCDVHREVRVYRWHPQRDTCKCN